MKKLLSLLAMAMVAFACEPTPTPDPEPNPDPNPEAKPVLTIVGDDIVMFESAGGVGEISYTIENPSATLSLSAESAESWIGDIAVGDEKVTYTVAKNDGQVDRRGTIVLTYGEEEKTYTVLQESGADVFFAATSLAGSLCTEDYLGEGVHNYSVLLSVNGVTEENGYYADSEYYLLDLYADKTTYSKTSPIPVGTYTFTAGDKLTVGSLNAEKSCYIQTSSSNVEKTMLKAGEVVVSDGKIVATLTLTSGKVHQVEYVGALDVNVYSMPITGGFSTLTDDHYFDITGGVFVAAFVGDIMYQRCNTCSVYMFEYLDYETGEERGDQFVLDLQQPMSSNSENYDICGTYTAGVTVGHFVPGSIEDYGGGYYMPLNSYYNTPGYVDYALLVRGTIVVSKEDDGTYIFDIDTVDDKGNAIKGIFRGKGEFIDW